MDKLTDVEMNRQKKGHMDKQTYWQTDIMDIKWTNG